MKKLIILFILLFSSIIVLTAQSKKIEFGVTAQAGISQVEADFQTPYGFYTTGNYESNSGFSGGIGVFFEKPLSEKSIIGMKILGARITGKDEVYFQENAFLPDPNNLVSFSYQDESTLRLTYLVLPIYYKLNLNKFGISIGLQPMILLSGKLKYNVTETHFGDKFEYQDDDANFEVKRFQFGPIIGVEYAFSPSFSVETNFYPGVINVEDDRESGRDADRKIWCLTLGINYHFQTTH